MSRCDRGAVGCFWSSCERGGGTKVDQESALHSSSVWACRMSADMQHLQAEDLYDEVEAIISASDFIGKTDGAQLLFI